LYLDENLDWRVLGFESTGQVLALASTEMAVLF
jgi:hypothetical protein